MPVHACRHLHDDHDELLRLFLAGDGAARDELPRAVRPYLLALAGRMARDLPDDLRDELVGQALLNLLVQKPTAFDRSRGNARTFLRLMARNAASQVRAAYRRPGQPTRQRRPRAYMHKRAFSLPVVSFDDLSESEMPHVDPSTEVEARHDAEAILRRAPEPVATWLRRMYIDREPLQDVAATAGLSRFKLSRQIAEFARERRAA